MRIPLPGPADVRSLADQMMAVLPRVTGLLGGAERMLADAGRVLGGAERMLADAGRVIGGVDRLQEDVERLVERIEGTRGQAAAVAERTEGTRALAEEVIVDLDRPIARAKALLDRVEPLLDRFEPLLDRFEPSLVRLQPSLVALQPLLDRLVETTHPHEIDAMVSLVDQLPQIATRVETDVIPMLQTLRTVAPDLHDLLDVSRELNELLVKLPGMGRIKKKVEEQQEQEAEERAIL